MPNFATFRRQHEAILDLARQLVAAQSTLTTEADAARATRCLAKLTGVLQLHLAAEDKALYPRLQNSPHAIVASTATRFMEEMGELAPTYVAFEAKWRTTAAVRADPAGFVAETQAVLGALELRITRENDELYPLLNAIKSTPREAAA